MDVRFVSPIRFMVTGVALCGALFGIRADAQAGQYSGTPYGGSPAAVPGTIQAANFDNGADGVAYHDGSAGNAGGAYRNTNMDITTSVEGGYCLGWLNTGEWANYTVNVANSGLYNVTIRLASPNGGGQLHIGFNGSAGSWTPVSVPATGGWQSWAGVTLQLNLTAGVQQMTMAFDTPGYNLSYVVIQPSDGAGGTGGGGGGGGGTLSPYGGTPAAVPGTIQAANFDNGGEGVAYHDQTAGNTGGAYRNTDVDLASSTEGGYTIGWIGGGEWVNYTVNVQNSGAYTAQIRVASPGGGSLHIGFNQSGGSWTSVSVPATGGWQSWSTVNVPMNLTAGVQQMTLLFDTGGYNVSYVKMAAAASAPAPPPPPPSGGGRFRMLTWNMNSGKDPNNNYVLSSQMAFLASQNADVMVLQEVQTWDEYQPTRIPQLLQAYTGQTWYTVWAPSSACAVGGCIGELIVSRIPISDSTTTYLGPSDAGRALIYIGGVPVNIITNHLEYYDTGLRTSELYGLMSFARNFGGPRLVGGDFNSWWGEFWITQMETEYHDSWVDVSNTQDGAYTKGNVRFDYIFRSFDGDWRVTPLNAWVAGTGLSDHSPFVVDFAVQ